MLPQNKFEQLQAFVQSSTRDELIWINGYLSGLVAEASSPAPEPAKRQPQKITLAYGTETGNAKSLATQLSAVARQNGVNAKLIGLDQYRVSDLDREQIFIVVISTQGEGEPPVNAKKFYDYLHATPLKLPQLRYAVLGLGDSSYPLFNKTAEDVDARLKEAGATSLLSLKKCDVDYEADAKAWFNELLNVVQSAPATLDEKPATVASPQVARPAGKKFYEARILANINLNDRGSRKQTYHIELGTEEPIAYEPGDTIGIIPHNRPDVVRRIIKLTGIDPELMVETAKHTASVETLLSRHLGICYLLSSTIKKYAALTGHDVPDTRMDLIDLLRIYPVKDAAQFVEVVKLLVPIAPRLYSIASSPEAHGEREVHITVARDSFMAEDEQRFGLCSEFLGDKPVGAEISFYVHKDKHFKLPAPDKDIIMIGPGTGVAPFRAFLSERNATGASGRNWFFFGEQHFVTDFLYQTEMQQFLATGVLNRFDLAFSRDQAEKIYVQHRMREKSDELFRWIEGGASVYISGTKDPMSKDVEKCLIEIFQQKGNMDNNSATKKLEEMRKQGRYAKDVY
ncbi:MAG: sulfite reductase flavoprotein subunit alpha [Chitinophagaceae bacterium]